MRLPSTKNLQAFLATAEYLNLTHAAESLNMTQGAVSRQIQSLESLMGVSLFYRRARGLALTPEGSLFLPLAQDIIKRLQRSVREVSESANRVKLLAPSCITTWLLARLANFQQANPDVNVELTSTTKHQLHPDFDSFDMVIVYGKPARSKQVSQTLLFDEILAPVCSPQLWSQCVEEDDPVQDTLVNRFMWLHANQEQSDWALWCDSSNESALKGTGNQTFATLDQAMHAAQQGFGMTVGDVTLADQDIKSNRLLCPFDKRIRSGNSYFLLSANQEPNDSVKALSDWLAHN
ncbi:LysR family transcriptional regulator [Vibrio sp. Isolate24]|uniref:LysR family transcriptional regulator n=1 Tax=Vibrio sp. Isolate24 TaxID=2908534 RepID=UPI001EFD199A|nr:LysR family transcriptional regulator [Vibrio sp. Isolate24]MCG9676820.1 LysR substrate-binding domain-containing protein [Vibrio sp. Isolate24]